MKRAAIYTRVSTDEQAAKGYGLQTQLEHCRNYASKIEYRIVDEISDDISGMVKLEDRPGGDRLLSLIEAGDIDALIIYSPDRLSRDTIDLQQYGRMIHDYEIELHVESMGLIPYDDLGEISFFMFGFRAHGEHTLITKRTLGGKYDKARGNEQKNIPPKPVMTGFPPYGYKKDGERNKAKMLIFEPHAQNVRSIFEWYVNGDGRNGSLSLCAIARKLDASNISPPDFRSDAAPYWIPSTIKRILNNEIYAGVT